MHINNNCENIQKVEDQTIVQSVCTPLDISVVQGSYTYLASLDVPNDLHVIELTYTDRECLEKVDIAYLVEGEHEAILVPRTTHNIYVYPGKMRPNMTGSVRMMIKPLVRGYLKTQLYQCSMKITIYTKLILENKVKSTLHENLPSNLQMAGVTRAVLSGRKIHYFAHLNTSVRNWYDVKAFCKDTLNADLLTYFSQTEIMEIAALEEYMSRRTGIVFTSFQTMREVNIEHEY